MAITKLLRLKESVRGSPATHLKHNLFYICNPDKCGGGIWIGGNAGTSPEIIFQTMVDNKKYWGKEDGSQGFHYVISFPPELDVSEETAYQIAEDFSRELLGDDYYYAFAVHNDQRHMHVHITFDSVSKTDGYKFHSPKGDWEKRVQPITDRICKKYGLPILEFTEEKKGKQYGEWKHEQDKKSGKTKDISWYDLIRDDIDLAVRTCDSYEGVLTFLRDRGYEVKEGKFLSLRPYGRERPVRSSRLGKGYTIDGIKERVKHKTRAGMEEEYPRYGDMDEMKTILLLRIRKTVGWKMTPFMRSYYSRWYHSFLRNKPGQFQPWKRNVDVVRIRALSDAVKYMVDQDIRSFEDLEEKWKELSKRKKSLEAERNAVISRLRKQAPYADLRRYEKQKTEFVDDPSAEHKRQMDFLLEKIEEAMPLEEAVRTRDLLVKEADALRLQIQKVKEEQKLAEHLYTFYFDMPAGMEKPEDVRRDGPEKNASISGGPAETSRIGQRKNRHTEHGERIRITVHKSLILDGTTEQEYVVKLPGKEKALHIPAGDCLMYKSGEVLSAFMYEEEIYMLEELQDGRIMQVQGKEAASFFDRKKDRMREKGR